MVVVLDGPTKPKFRRSDIDSKARAFSVAPTGLRLVFALGYKHGAPTELSMQFVVHPPSTRRALFSLGGPFGFHLFE